MREIDVLFLTGSDNTDTARTIPYKVMGQTCIISTKSLICFSPYFELQSKTDDNSKNMVYASGHYTCIFIFHMEYLLTTFLHSRLKNKCTYITLFDEIHKVMTKSMLGHSEIQ